MLINTYIYILTLFSILYVVYNTEPCTECGINGYCASKVNNQF